MISKPLKHAHTSKIKVRITSTGYEAMEQPRVGARVLLLTTPRKMPVVIICISRLLPHESEETKQDLSVSSSHQLELLADV